MYLDDMTVGTSFEVGPVTIDKDKMVAFSLEYDPFRVHHDEEFAAKSRYGRLIAPGVMTFMMMWAKVIESGFFGEQQIAGKSTHIEWCKPAYPGDVLTGRCTVTRITPRNPYNGIAETLVEVYNQHGELVLTNVTESVIKYRKADET